MWDVAAFSVFSQAVSEEAIEGDSNNVVTVVANSATDGLLLDCLSLCF